MYRVQGLGFLGLTGFIEFRVRGLRFRKHRQDRSPDCFFVLNIFWLCEYPKPEAVELPLRLKRVKRPERAANREGMPRSKLNPIPSTSALLLEVPKEKSNDAVEKTPHPERKL